MEISTLLIRVVFLLLPGIIGRTLYRQLREAGPPRRIWEEIAEVLVFSVASYAIIVLGFQSASSPTRGDPTALDAFFSESTPIPWADIAAASGIAIGLAIGAGYVNHFELLHRAARFIRATNQTGYGDVWRIFNNSRESPNRPLYVRDAARGVIYYGYIDYFSEHPEDRELILSEVEVYSPESFERLYQAQSIYLCRPKHELTLELPVFESEPSSETSDTE